MIGSKDSWLAISELDQAQGWMRTADGEKADAALKYTRGKAEQRFLQVLLARFLLLDLLVREAEQLPAGLREEHRRLWVLLQAQPPIFGEGFEGNIFTTLTRLLHYTDTDDLKK